MKIKNTILAICLSSFLVVASWADDSAIFLKKDDQGRSWYRTPFNNGIFAMSYQLKGSFRRISSDEDLIICLFTGSVVEAMSGNQLAHSGGNETEYTCRVTDMPLRISRWSDNESKTWGKNLSTFEEINSILSNDTSHDLLMALKHPKYMFASGDLLAIEASQIDIEKSNQSE
jgi:hypothetical protein